MSILEVIVIFDIAKLNDNLMSDILISINIVREDREMEIE